MKNLMVGRISLENAGTLDSRFGFCHAGNGSGSISNLRRGRFLRVPLLFLR